MGYRGFSPCTGARRDAVRAVGVVVAVGLGLGAALLTAGACSPGPALDAAPAEAASPLPRPATSGAPLVTEARPVAQTPASGQAPAPAETPALPPAQMSSALPEYVGAIHGQFVEQWFYSAALDRTMRYFVYLPPDYETSSRTYPVLYMLHGASGEAEEWVAYGLVTRVDHAIATRAIAPYLVVLPEGEFGYWINHAYDGPRWGDYVAQDVVGHVDRTFRTRPSAQGRAIGGLSMGATGGLIQAFTNPHIFGVVGAHSPTPREDNAVVWFLGEGEEFAARDAIHLARTAPGIERLQIWIDIGDEDAFLPRARALQLALAERGVPHQWQIRRGDHWEGYWIDNMADYINFYHRALNPG